MNEKIRELAGEIGMSRAKTYQTMVVAQELASNLVFHAGGGRLSVATVNKVSDGGTVRGIQLTATDDGPGIADLEEASRDGFSTRGGLGLGIGAMYRLMDDIEFISAGGKGTVVVARKWAGQR